MKKSSIFVGIGSLLLVIILVAGCGGGGGGPTGPANPPVLGNYNVNPNPANSGATIVLTIDYVDPSGTMNEGISAPPVSSENNYIRETDGQGHSLLGIWDIRVDLAGLTAVPVPLRDVQMHYNITGAVAPGICPDCLNIKMISFNPETRVLEADVTLSNPFMDAARDVRGARCGA